MTPIDQVDEQELRALLDHLATGQLHEGEGYRGWGITPTMAGWNNLLYRVTGPGGDLVIKFVIRDRRDRAGREYHALLALRQAGLSLAPVPILLDRRRYPQPVVVQTWLEGPVSADPPAGDAEWERLLEHLAAVHSVTPESTSVALRRGVVDARTAEEGRTLVRRQMARLPLEDRPSSLQALMRRFEMMTFPCWSRVAPVLCRVDENIFNVVRRPGAWASGDWENAGWGDPAFDVAQLMTHPAYTTYLPGAGRG